MKYRLFKTLAHGRYREVNIFKTKTKKLALAYVENRKRQALKNILSKARILISEKTDAETHPVYLLIKELANLVYSETIYENISTQENDKVTKVTINQIIPYQTLKTSLAIQFQKLILMIWRIRLLRFYVKCLKKKFLSTQENTIS